MSGEVAWTCPEPLGVGDEAEGGCVCCSPAGIGILPCVPLPLVVCLHKCLLDCSPARCPQEQAVPPCRSLVHTSCLLVLLVPAWPRPSDLTPLVRSARWPRSGSSPFRVRSSPVKVGLTPQGFVRSSHVVAACPLVLDRGGPWKLGRESLQLSLTLRRPRPPVGVSEVWGYML